MLLRQIDIILVAQLSSIHFLQNCSLVLIHPPIVVRRIFKLYPAMGMELIIPLKGRRMGMGKENGALEQLWRRKKFAYDAKNIVEDVAHTQCQIHPGLSKLHMLLLTNM